MAQQKVELRRIRDFGENLNDSILFIRQNFKPLLASFLGIAGIFMLTSAVLNGIYQSRLGNVFQEIFNGPNQEVTRLEIFNGNYFLLLFFSWLNFVAMQVVVTSYFKLYEIKQTEPPTVSEVWDTFKRYFLKVFFYSTITLLLMLAGFVLCFIPGIYFMVVFAPFAAILIIEGQTFGEAFSRCFALIKDNFWISLGIYLLTYLISSISSGIISAVVGAIGGLISYFTTRNLNVTVGIVVSILDIFGFIFYLIYYVAVMLHYFNLTERHDGTGLIKRLDSIGRNDRDFENIQEQY